MNPGRDRTLVLAMCAFTLVLLCASAASHVLFPYYGPGIEVTGTSVQNVLRITSVDAAVARAGLRAGDTIDVTGQIYDRPHALSQQNIRAMRQGRTLLVRLPAEYPQISPGFVLTCLAQLWMLLFALLIVLRGAKASGSTMLAVILTCDALSWALYTVVTPSPWITVTINGIGLALTPVARFALLTSYFSSFARPLQGARLWWTRVAYGATALGVAAVAYFYVFHVFHVVRPLLTGLAAEEMFSIAFQSGVVPVAVCGILAVRAARAEDAGRIAWVAGSYDMFFVFWTLAGPLGFLWGPYDDLAWQIESAAHLLVPLGLSYAALRRRLFDIGFVINRAAIFTGVSLVVIGAFVLLEWSLGTWLANAGRTTSLALNLALALGLGVSLRFIHARVERVIDAVLFRKRHENEEALRNFAREAAYITDARTLVERTASTIECHADVSSVQIIGEEALTSAELENDPAIVKLRAWNAPVDLHTVTTVLDGEWAYPMTVRGGLVGAIVLGPRRSSESYAPDESSAIAQVAQSAGNALDALALKRPDYVHEVLEAIHALRAEVRAALMRTT